MNLRLSRPLGLIGRVQVPDARQLLAGAVAESALVDEALADAEPDHHRQHGHSRADQPLPACSTGIFPERCEQLRHRRIPLDGGRAQTAQEDPAHPERHLASRGRGSDCPLHDVRGELVSFFPGNGRSP